MGTPTPGHPMPTRAIGDLTVSALGLGCMGMSMTYGRPDLREARHTIDRALELGVTLFDTADMYGNGHNERFVGQALGSRRDRITLASKFGILTVPLAGLPRGVNGSPAYVRRACEASLRRLGTDVIDLYYLHRIDANVPIEDTVGAMAELVRQGNVRHLGLSEASGEHLRRAHAVHPIAALQSEWSIFSREIEADALPVARELGIAIVPYSPLGRGMLTGSPASTTKLPLLDYRRFLPRWRRANLAHNLGVVERVRAVAADLGVTPGQVALAWVLAQGSDVVPIPGTKRAAYLEENCAAVHVTLPPAAMDALGNLHARGARYAGVPGATGIPGAR